MASLFFFSLFFSFPPSFFSLARAAVRAVCDELVCLCRPCLPPLSLPLPGVCVCVCVCVCVRARARVRACFYVCALPPALNPYTLHPTPYTLHPTPYTLTLNPLNPTFEIRNPDPLTPIP